MLNTRVSTVLIAVAIAARSVGAAEPVVMGIEPYLPSAVQPTRGLPGIAPLTLDALLRIALDQNPLQPAAREGVASAKESVGVAKAPYYPLVSMNAGYRRWETHAFLPSGLGGPNPPSTIGPGDDWSLALKVS